MESKKVKYQERIVAFVDILGFSSLVGRSEVDSSIIEKIDNTLKFLKKLENPIGWNLDTIAIEEDAQKKGVETFEIEDKTSITCFSDSILVSVDISSIGLNEAASTLIANLAYIGSYLLTEGILIRGGITTGNLIHLEDGVVFGQGLIDAYRLENSLAIFPRIVLSKKILTQMNYPLTAKRDRFPYHQYLRRFDDGCVGFHQLQFFEVVRSWTEMTEDRLAKNLALSKKVIIDGLDENLENIEIYKKFDWLRTQYNSLIIIEKGLKKPIRKLNEGITGGNIHYSYTDDFYQKNENGEDI